MSPTVLDMSISLDGFIAGPHESLENGLGDGGQRLHDWVMPRDASGRFLDTPPTGADAEAAEPYGDDLGARVCGRGTVDPAGGWGGDDYAGPPVFVYSRTPLGPGDPRWPRFTYIDTIEEAVRRARDAAGDGTVLIQGAGAGQAALAAGLVDEIRLHLVPVLLGDGRRLFAQPGPGQELEQLSVTPGSAVHLRYAVRTRPAEG